MRSAVRHALSLAIVSALPGVLPAGAAEPPATPDDGSGRARRAKSSAALPEIQVEGFRAEQASGAKVQRPLQETPRIITVLPEALLREQGVTTLKDALRNQPGISLQAGEGNPPGGDQLKIRGFNARDDINVNGARDLGNYFRDPFYVDQIEIVKGPNSTYAGRGSTGGTINFVTKTPQLQDFNRAELSLGSDEFKRVSADLNRQLGDDAALRVNLMAHDAALPGRDIAEEKRHGAYLAYAWGIGGDTQISADLLHLKQNDIPDAGLPIDRDPASANSRGTGALPPGLDFDNFYGHVDDYKDVDVNLLGFTVEHSFGSGLLLRNQLRVSEVGNDSITSSPRIRSIPATSPAFEGAQVRGDTKPRDQTDEGISSQTSLGLSFDTGAIAHDLVAGLEFGEFDYENRRRPDVSGALTDLYDPQPRRRPATPYDGTVHRFRTDELALYALDVMRLAPGWDLHLGLRRDRVEAEASEAGRENLPTPGDNRRLSRTDEVTSWNAGLVRILSPTTSLYASVGTSFDISGNFDRNQVQLAGGATARVADAATFNLRPERTTAYEFGAKWLLGDALSINAALFETDKDRARFPGQAGGDNSILDSELRVRGLELLMAGQVNAAWRLYAGYAYLDGEVLAAPSRPFAVGQELGGTPKHSFSAFTTYDLTEALSVGGGVQYVDAQFGSVQASATGTVKARIPDYTVFDLYATWRLSDRLSLRMNAFNVADERYISQLAEGGGQGIPGPGRQLVGTLRYDF
jgi:catecholate siderophore receptor